jgi:aryl-alcohol dehydrogenase-like predicted oxidoreductase
MVSRALGQTGLAVGAISLGTAKLGRNTDVKYPAPFALPTDKQVEELLQSAVGMGVNLVDTAPAYGECERRLGPFVERYRDRLVVCTKCGEQYTNGRSVYDFSASAISRSVDESLRRLRTERIDILVLHSDGRDVEILTQTDAPAQLLKLKRSGKVRAIGLSAKTAAGVAAASRTLDVVMAPFSQKEQSLAEALTHAHDAGVGVLAIKGLFSGHLEPAPAIEFIVQQPFIDTLILGTIDAAHLREAVTIASQHSAKIR